jgi:hypothetical protein
MQDALQSQDVVLLKHNAPYSVTWRLGVRHRGR